MSDGSIKIGTELDTTGIEKGLNTFKNQNRRTFEQMAKDTGKSVEEIRELFHKTVERIKKEYAELNNGKLLDNANAHKKAYKELGLLAEKNAKEVSKQADKISDSYQKSANSIPTFFKKGFAGLGSIAKSGIAGLGSITKTAVAGITTAIAGVSTGIGGLGAASISVGKNFETAMSKVQATSGASADDLEKLKEKALEMGASTKFSASESAEALNYMAMAGWKTEQMIGGIGGIMDLAAASGEDLAMVSDIVTDGLTGFKLSAKDSSSFADVLAAATSNANTNVAMLGESFKYVSPIAGALGYSVEDTSVALGLMANSGIKASQAGTTLRSLMSNLASPTKNSAMAIQQLGLNIKDSKGNMLPFNDVMVQLRESFKGLTEAEKAQYAEMLAGKEAMSGILAVANASQEDFDKLTGSINNSTGAAAKMAEIMSDNLQGRLKELSSKLEYLGIRIYESIQEPLKEVTEYATGLVTELQNAFDKGGFEGVINSLGTIISKALTDISAKAPQVIEIAAQFILNFLDGINKNSEKLGQAGSQILTSLINGIFVILPEFITTAGNLVINFQEGIIASLPILLENGKQMLENLSKGIIENLPTILENGNKILMGLVNGLIDNLPLIIDTGIEIILALVDSLVDSLPELIPACVEAILTIADTLVDNLDDIIDAAIELMLALADGLIDAIPLLVEKVPIIITKIVKKLDEPETRMKLINAGMQLILALIEGTAKMNIAIGKAVWGIIKDFVSGFTDKKNAEDIREAGKDLIRGLINGIKSMASEIYNTMKEFCGSIVKDVKGFFGIHSPSRLFRDEVGVMLVKGMIVGVQKENKNLVDALVTPFSMVKDELTPQKSIYTDTVVNAIKDGKDAAQKEAKNYKEVGEILISSIADSVKSKNDKILEPLKEKIDKDLKENIEKVEKSGEELINTYTKKINSEANEKISKIEETIGRLPKSASETTKKQLQNEKKSIEENAKGLIKTYSNSVKKSISEEKETLKSTANDLIGVIVTNLEQGAELINETINTKIGGLAENYQTKFNDLISAQESLTSKLSETELFTFEDDKLIIEDLDKTINKLEEYDQVITKLKERGISDAILGELSSYSVDEVLAISEKLLQMTDKDFEDLNQKWSEKQVLASQVASNFYKEQMEILEKDFNTELIRTLNELPNEVEDIGIMTITGFQNGVTSKMDTIKSQVKDFANSVISEMQQALDIHSPSRKTRWLGEMLDAGLVKGIEDGEKDILSTIKNLGIIDTFKKQLPDIQGIVNGAASNMIPKAANYINNTNTTKNITNNQGDLILNVHNLENKGSNSMQTFLQGAAFYQKQRAQALGVW